MSFRLAKKPLPVPSGVEVTIDGQMVKAKGSKGELTLDVHQLVSVKMEDGHLMVTTADDEDEGGDGKTQVGTTFALIRNNIKGVSEGFDKKLQLVGVGYRAQSGKAQEGRHKLDLTLGLSHPVTYIAPQGIELETPSATEIVVKGISKHLVGQTASDIRSICKGVRKPEPYKGKGIRYADERIILKETKKK